MTFRGSFSPSTETRPPMTHSGNLVADSSLEAGAPSVTVSGCTAEWSTEQAHTGNRSIKLTLTSSTWHAVLPVSVADVDTWQLSLAVRPSAARAIGLTIEYDGTTSSLGSFGIGPNVWTVLHDELAPDSGLLEGIRVGGSPGFGWQIGDVIYLDSYQVIEIPSIPAQLQAWRPHTDEAFYIAGDFWQIVGATATFDGVEWSAGDLITATGTPQHGYVYLDNVTWNRTEFVPSPDGPIAQLLQQRPTDNVGYPV